MRSHEQQPKSARVDGYPLREYYPRGVKYVATFLKAYRDGLSHADARELAEREVDEDETVTCTTCNGSGVVMWDVPSNRPDLDTRWVEEECPDCDGRGEVER
jgi:hypothetical protein